MLALEKSSVTAAKLHQLFSRPYTDNQRLKQNDVSDVIYDVARDTVHSTCNMCVDLTPQVDWGPSAHSCCCCCCCCCV